jgi:Flp pilus assembly protein TadB
MAEHMHFINDEFKVGSSRSAATYRFAGSCKYEEPRFFIIVVV